MTTNLVKWAYAMNVALWVEKGKIRFRAEIGLLTDQIRQQLINNKELLITRLFQIQGAHIHQWMIFEFGEMYCKRVAENTELYIFRNDDDTYTVWRASYRIGIFKPLSEKTIAERVPFREAFDRANNYYNWAVNNKFKRQN